MTKILFMKLDEIQPSQLYISSRKLNRVMENFASKPSLMEPIPIKKLGDRIVFVDGHTRAFAALLHRFPKVPVYWEDEELDWELYEICVKWCIDEKIHSIGDLSKQIIPHEQYEQLWYKRCEDLHASIEQQRSKQ